MPAHLRPPEHRPTRPLSALVVAFVIAFLVLGAFSGPPQESTTRLVQPATDVSTEPTVLGEVIERMVVPDAPPASATGFTTTTAESSAPSGGGSVATSPATSPPPSLAPPVSITRPAPPRPTTTTTAPSTTTTTDDTTTTTEGESPEWPTTTG